MKKFFIFLCLIAFIISIQTKKKSFLQTRLKTKDYNYFKLLTDFSSIKIEYNKELKIGDDLYAYYNDDSDKIELYSNQIDTKFNDLVAFGKYSRTRFKSGWDSLELETYTNGNPIIQCYSAGIIEGILTQKEIYYYFNNFKFFFITEPESYDLMKNFFKDVDKNIKNIILGNNSNHFDTLQKSYISCFHAQLYGLLNGYNLMAEKNETVDLFDLYILNTEGNFMNTIDYLKINKMNINSKDEFFKKENIEFFYNTSKIEEIWNKLKDRSHCSAIVKYIDLGNNNHDVFLGHNTWSGFNELLKIIKKIKFAFEGENQKIGMKPIRIKFTSYPAVIFSGDEFYIINNNLAITETTLSVINKFLYKDCIDKKNYIPEFMRVMMINYMSRSGHEWKDNYININKNKHLYASSWIVIDYNYINKDNNLMFIIEDIPKKVQFRDYTFFLKNLGYYGSFNLPYFKRENGQSIGLFENSDTDFYGNINLNPREYILDKLIYKVKNFKDFEGLLNYNGHNKINDLLAKDPSYNNPRNGIASRDLYSGATDFKIINKEMIKNGTIYVYSGPLYRYNKAFTPFTTKTASNILKPFLKGIPEVFDFKPFYFK